MKMMLWGLLLATGLAQAAMYQPVVPKFEQAAATRAKDNQWQDIGTVQIGNVVLPAYSVTVREPMEGGLLTSDVLCKPACRWRFAKSETLVRHQNELVALHVAGLGWLLVPKAWRNLEAGLGVNGSKSLLIKSNDGKGYITYQHTGACVGCALSSAAPFYPQAFQDARDYGFAPRAANPYIKLVRAANGRTLFSYILPNQYPTHGVAYFVSQADTPYQDMRVSLPVEQKALAGVILNAFVH